MPSVQTLDARYIDGQALLALLTRLFGKGNFKLDVRDVAALLLLPEDRHIDDVYKLTVPKELSRDQELSVRTDV